MNDTREVQRPSPEAMLKAAHSEEAEENRGRLKIFLGYAAGVGKTYTMLQTARQQRAEGREAVAGYIESHGRAETDALLEGMEILPRIRREYQGILLEEFDLDAALRRKPNLILVDELAHSNTSGCRHPKRWQDIEELLAAGIHVYTTVNVQHFESVVDVVAQITGITVQETVPDSMLDLLAGVPASGCTLNGTRQPFSDSVYDGVFEYWSACGGMNTEYFTIAATAKDNSHLIWLQIQLVEGDDWVLEPIVNSFIAIY